MCWDILTLGLNIFNFPRFGIKSAWYKEVNLTPWNDFNRLKLSPLCSSQELLMLHCTLLTWESTGNGWRHWGFFWATWIYNFFQSAQEFHLLRKIFPCYLRLWAGKDFFFFFFNLHNLPKLSGNIKIPKLPGFFF